MSTQLILEDKTVFGASCNYEETMRIPKSEIAPLDSSSSLPCGASSKYQFIECNDVLMVKRGSETISLQLDRFSHRWSDPTDEYGFSLGLLAKKELIKKIADRLVDKMPLVKKKVKGGPNPNWVVNQVAKRIGKQISAFVDKQWAKLPPDVIDFHRAIFRYGGFTKYQSIVGNLEEPTHFFKKHKYYVNDCIKNPLAICVVENSMFFEDMCRRYSSDKWIHYLSGGKPYSYLTKTLSNLKPPVSTYILRGLVATKLPREFNSKTEFIAFMIGATHINYTNGLHKHSLDGITESDLKKIFVEMSRPDRNLVVRRKRQHWNKYKYLHIMVNYAMDCDYAGECSFLNLFRHSLDWHRQFQNRPYAGRQLGIRPKRFPDTMKFHTPPIPLPTAKGITFIGTYGELYLEGNKMEHCVETYAERCVRGDSYIFHVEHNGKEATAELLRDGRVNQVSGPQNGSNQACAYAKKKLCEWAYKGGWLKLAHTSKDINMVRGVRNVFEDAELLEFHEQPF